MPDFNWEGLFLDSVGLEIESIFLNKDSIAEPVISAVQKVFGTKRVLNITRDASTEFVAEMLRVEGARSRVYISTHTDISNNVRGTGQGNTVTFGYELFTNPLTIPDMESLIFPLIYSLISIGDSTSRRAATHVHVGFAQNLRLMKRLLRLSLTLDPVLFRLAGMGGVFRGYSNLAAYARPLLNSVAVRLSSDRDQELSLFGRNDNSSRIIRKNVEPKYVRIINPLKALEATNLEDFWASFGVSRGNLTKYHPARYTATNLFSILAHGTIEYRHFNNSLDPHLILSIIKFLRSFVDLSTSISKEELNQFEIINPNVEISLSDGVEIITRFYNLFNKYDIEYVPNSYQMETLISTLGKSKFIPLPETPVLTHIRDFYMTPSLAERGGLISIPEVLDPEYVDIHNITQKEISMFDSEEV